MEFEPRYNNGRSMPKRAVYNRMEDALYLPTFESRAITMQWLTKLSTREDSFYIEKGVWDSRALREPRIYDLSNKRLCVSVGAALYALQRHMSRLPNDHEFNKQLHVEIESLPTPDWALRALIFVDPTNELDIYETIEGLGNRNDGEGHQGRGVMNAR